MREICKSGSEGGGTTSELPTPIQSPGLCHSGPLRGRFVYNPAFAWATIAWNAGISAMASSLIIFRLTWMPWVFSP